MDQQAQAGMSNGHPIKSARLEFANEPTAYLAIMPLTTPTIAISTPPPTPPEAI